MDYVTLADIGNFLNNLFTGFESFIFFGFVLLIVNSVSLYVLTLLSGGKL